MIETLGYTLLLIGIAIGIIFIVWLIRNRRPKASCLTLTAKGRWYRCPDKFNIMVFFITVFYVTTISGSMMILDVVRRIMLGLFSLYFLGVLILLYLCQYRSYLFINTDKIEFRILWRIRTIDKYDIGDIYMKWGFLSIKLKSGKRVTIPSMYYMYDTGVTGLIKDLKALADSETFTKSEDTYPRSEK